jgi:diguanylate cyclase (GGDEF)-like protein/PAS domain S-box-containing protein
MSHVVLNCVDVLDTIACGIVLLDANGRILVWNRWMTRYSGVADEAALGLTLPEVFPEIAGSRLEAAVSLALSHRLPGVLSPSIHRPPLPLFQRAADRANGTRLQQLINVTPLRLAAESGCTLQIHDVSLSVKRERKLREQTDALEASNASLQAKLDEIEALHSQIAAMSKRDALSGLYARKHLDQELPKAFNAAIAQGLPTSLMMVDIDLLGQVNDEYGREAGDAVLKAAGALLLEKLPPKALAGRFDQDDFVVLLPGVTSDLARQMAESWRLAFADMSIDSGEETVRATLSVGIAGTVENGDDLYSLYEYLKLALFLAKHDGYNRVVVFDSG